MRVEITIGGVLQDNKRLMLILLNMEGFDDVRMGEGGK